MHAPPPHVARVCVLLGGGAEVRPRVGSPPPAEGGGGDWGELSPLSYAARLLRSALQPVALETARGGLPAYSPSAVVAGARVRAPPLRLAATGPCEGTRWAGRQQEGPWWGPWCA